MSIQLHQISKRFGPTVVCENVDLHIPAGEMVALLGPSGSGKTTLLRIMAGLEAPDAGRVFMHGEDATDASVQERRVGFVFQHYALFNHLSVRDNVAFGLRVQPRAQRLPEAQIRRRVDELLERVQLSALAGRHPNQLSGGQRQRVALARALAVQPQVLLLDEPFGALDAQVRKELRRWLRRLHEDMHVTSVFVTHDQEEAMEVADRIVVMNKGRIEQEGHPQELYDRPASPFVLQFLGDAQRLDDGGTPLWVRSHEIAVHPEHAPGRLAATLVHALCMGPRMRLGFQRPDGAAVEVELTREEFQAQPLDVGRAYHLEARRPARFQQAA
ncbi:sulfate/molybdate ABC transporter ATP-binding protein [uncultured Azohydromonas sp.]|jgi:sulfate ABC transporter, ATP-binding protein|uniref:sulfate/molybdate ABC transporter ATP-binding protein n=1 Tax=uncultured Azohydromonas sp. TaxID=487342 RepID=UPI00260943FF|nr:sulfate ABC transporter ATP-binding protein [uncultured Azohydromonas sp.]